MKVLVDTSAWSLALRRKATTQATQEARTVLADLIADSRVEIMGVIRQEVLSGISQRSQFDNLKHRLNAFIDIAPETKDFELAAEFFNSCRAKGVQGSSTDFLICAVAVRRDMLIYTYDNDFLKYQAIIPIKLFVSPSG